MTDPAAPYAAVLRAETAGVVAHLARLVRDLDRAEEIYQDACLAAVEAWRGGVPERPGAWLLTVARRRALDELRRDARTRRVHAAVAREREGDEAPAADVLELEVEDDRLRLVFTCCHPVLTPESQVALTLRLVAGLTTAEIARAFLAAEPTVAQRIARAKRTLREAGVPYEVPTGGELAARLEAVLRVVYLVFNEGYVAARADGLVRVDLQDEALRLAGALTALLPDAAEARGLLALLWLQSSRAAARVDPTGGLVRLEEQDRSRWDTARIARGIEVLDALGAARTVGAVGPPGPYEIEARLAACHARASTFAATDWAAIVALYDVLQATAPSPVVALNRAVALGRRDGAAAGLAATLAVGDALADYHLWHAVHADFLERLGRRAEAAVAYRRAAAGTGNAAERAFLEARAIAAEQR